MPDYKDYFDLEDSYLKACQIIEHHTKKELTWSNIAKYHSGTKKYNDRYKERLFKILKEHIKEN
jgi:hypothetical protein